MIPTLQPSRPKVQPQLQHPQYQQQIRATHSQAPSSQIEAMPPDPPSTRTPTANQPAPSPAYNPATTHPVFFTNSWRRPPFPMPFNSGFSPVATGYVFGDARKRSQSMTKL